MPVDVTLLERLPDPVLLVLPGGETLYANRAFHDLAARHGVEPKLTALFGPSAQVVLAEARRSGRSNAFLPVVASEHADQGFRLTAQAGDDDGTIAVQLTDLSEEVAWRHQLFLRNSELTVLNDIGMALSGTLEMDVLARRIWEQTGRMMDNSHFFLALHDRETNSIQFALWVEEGRIAGVNRARPFSNSVTEHMILSRQPVLLNGDVHAQLQQMGVEPLGRPSVSFVGVPILSDGEAIGILALQDYEVEGRYGRHELGVLNVVGTQASAAIRNARLFETTRRAYEELSAAQSRLLESERLRGVTETVGALNHEVNNPLATIVGTAQLLLRAEGLDPETRQKVERVLEGAKRIQSVTGKMATLIQANSRPYPGQTRILDLRGSLAHGEGAKPKSDSALLRAAREALALRAAAAVDRPAAPPSATREAGPEAGAA
ncbi:MAG: GAF domain-containing protein [Candidatus Eisenbacteria bacterium]|nr:GAF domain-containing protein [Candidatus Eisenbacteria bacterium]